MYIAYVVLEQTKYVFFWSIYHSTLLSYAMLWPPHRVQQEHREMQARREKLVLLDWLGPEVLQGSLVLLAQPDKPELKGREGLL